MARTVDGDRIWVDEPEGGVQVAGATFVRGRAWVGGQAVVPRVEAGTAALWLDRDDFAGWVDLGDGAAGPMELVFVAGSARAVLAVEAVATDLQVACDAPALTPVPTYTLVGVEVTARDASAVHVAARHGTQPLEPGAADGTFAGLVEVRDAAVLAVVAQAAGGARRCRPVAIRRPSAESLDVAVERVDRDGGSLRVKGYALWPAPAPADARVTVTAGSASARAPATLSRPEMAGFANPWGVTARCGFDIALDDDEPQAPLEVGVTVDDGDRSTTVTVAAGPVAPVRPVAAELVAAARSASHDGATVVDWDAGIGGPAIAAGLRPLAPPVPADALPYASRSVDVVVVGRDEPRRIADAERVARLAVVRANAGGVETLIVGHPPDRPVPTRPPTADRRALLVVHRPPDLHGTPGARRAAIDAEALLSDGWDVTVIADDVVAADAPLRRAWQARGVPVFSGPYARGIAEDYLEDPRELIASGRFDFASIQWWWIAERYLPMVRDVAPRTPVLYEAGSLQSVIRSRPGRPPRPEDGHVLKAEHASLAGADAVALPSARECAMAADMVGSRPTVHHVPVSRPLRAATAPGAAQRRGILFVGNFDFWPNEDALEYLCGDVLHAIPGDPEVTVVGFGMAPALARRLHDRGLHVVGPVPRLEPYLDAARVLAVPLRHASGVTNKVLDGLAAGLPVVTTPLGAEGLDLEDADGLLVADGPRRLADALAELLTDDERWEDVARRGRAWVAEFHSPQREIEAWREARDAAIAARR